MIITVGRKAMAIIMAEFVNVRAKTAAKVKPKANNGAAKKYLSKLCTDIMRDKLLYIMLIPFVVYFVLFVYKPMYGLQIAFKDFNVFKGITDSPWVGMRNFTEFFQGPYFKRILVNTLMISLYDLIFCFPAPIIMALLFNELRVEKFKKFAQTTVYIPYFISAVVVAGLVTNFLSLNTGIINNFIALFGGERQYFLVQPQYFRGVYTVMNIWKTTGFNSIIYISALTSIDEGLYEAAVIDGASRWKQTLHITLPCLMPTMIMMFIMKIGNTLNVGYEQIILLYQPSTYETADVINTYVYRTGLLDANYSLASAVGLFNGVVGMILVCVTNYISKRITEYSLW